MLEKFLGAESGGFDDITDWMKEELDLASGDDFMREVSGMMDDHASFE